MELLHDLSFLFPKEPRTVVKQPATLKLDRVDFDILETLQNDARISNKELAQISGISPSTCLERVRRLKEHRVLTRFHAEVDRAAMGIGVEALISIRLHQQSNVDFDHFFKEIGQLEEVVSLYLLAGAVDILVHVAVQDVEQLRGLVVDTFNVRNEIAQLETSLIYQFEHCYALPNYRINKTEVKKK